MDSQIAMYPVYTSQADRQTKKDWNEAALRSVVGYNQFHIRNLLPDDAPLIEVHRLTALLNSLQYNGDLEKVGYTFIKNQNRKGKRRINLYRFRINRRKHTNKQNKFVHMHDNYNR